MVMRMYMKTSTIMCMMVDISLTDDSDEVTVMTWEEYNMGDINIHTHYQLLQQLLAFLAFL